MYDVVYSPAKNPTATRTTQSVDRPPTADADHDNDGNGSLLSAMHSLMFMNTACQRFYKATGAARPCITLYTRSKHNSITSLCGRRGYASSACFRPHLQRTLLTNRRTHINLLNRSSMSTVPNLENNMARAIVHLTIESIRSVRKSFDPSVSVGFVPTMGALHEGRHGLA